MSGSFRSIEDKMQEQARQPVPDETLAPQRKAEVVGHRANLIAVDDPYNGRLTKNREEDYYTQPYPEGPAICIVASSDRLAARAMNLMKAVVLRKNTPQSNIRFTAPFGTLCGSRFDYIIVIDDATKPPAERQRIDDWVQSVLRLRLSPGGELVWL